MSRLFQTVRLLHIITKNKAAPEEKPALAIDKASISLESSITMNFKVPKSSLSSYDDFYMTFKCNGKEEKGYTI